MDCKSLGQGLHLRFHLTETVTEDSLIMNYPEVSLLQKESGKWEGARVMAIDLI